MHGVHQRQATTSTATTTTPRRTHSLQQPPSHPPTAAPPPPALLPQVYQQLLKLLFLKVVPQARPNALIMDADVFWLKDVEFIDRKGRLLYTTANEMNSWSAR